MTPAYCQPINFIKVYKFAIFLAENKIAAPTALHEAKGVFSFAKENTPFGTPRERLRLAVSDLNDSYASGMGMPARGEPRLPLLYDLVCSYYPLPLCQSRGSSSLITVYRSIPQCGERSKAAIRKQSAAVLSSLAPHDSKARLRVVTTRRDSWRSHVHRTHTAQRVQSFKL